MRTACEQVANVTVVVHHQARNSFSGIVAAMGTRVVHLVPALVVNMAREFEAQEVVEILAFLGMLLHKLKVGRVILCVPRL